MPKKVAGKRSARTGQVAARSVERKKALTLKLAVTTRQLWMKFSQRAERVGVTRAKWTLIAVVARNPGATQRNIATSLQVTEATAGRLIDSLCKDGYLERREHPSDRRSYRIYLTPTAQPVMDQLGEIAKIHANEAFAGFSDRDLTTLDSLLDVLSRNIGVLAADQDKSSSGKGVPPAETASGGRRSVNVRPRSA